MAFVIFGLPRSRTYWLSQFLSYGNRQIGHDLSGEVRSTREFVNFVRAYGGVCDTGAVIGWRALRAEMPSATFITIRRPIGECIQSLRRTFAVELDLDDLKALDDMLDCLEASPGTIRYEYSDLKSAESCRRLFETCLGIAFDHDWWERLDSRNLQVDTRVFLENLPRRVNNFVILQEDMLARATGGQLN
jgi:hypothetical protein